MHVTEAFSELESRVSAALENYSNVHRGSGHYSMVSTHLFEQARGIVLDHLGLSKRNYVVIFCTPRRAEVLKSYLKPGSYRCLSGKETGLPLGVRALAVQRKALPKGIPFLAGGGTSRLMSRDWVIWANAPDRFEAGTPAIINIIAFAVALQVIKQSGINGFKCDAPEIPASELLFKDELEQFAGRELLDHLRQTMIGSNNSVPSTKGNSPYINLDNAASTPAFAPVWDTVKKSWRQPGQAHQGIITEVRTVCSQLLNAPLNSYDIIFTSNTTEAINLVAESLSKESLQDFEPVIMNTLLEHSSNDLPWRFIPDHSLIRFPVNTEGFLDPAGLDKLMSAYNQEGLHGKKRIRLVAVSGASNVLGTYNDLGEIAKIVHRHGARLLVDAAQMVAHRKVDMEKCGIDYLAFSAHKIYAPFGSGALVARKGMLSFSPAELELIHSSGEENISGIAALGKALVLLQRIGLDVIREEELVLTRKALLGMLQIPGISIYGIKDVESPEFVNKGGVIVFNLKNIMGNVAAKRLAEQGGIGIRFGCHCSHILVKHLLNVGPSLERFQRIMLTFLPKVQLPGVARISIGIGNSEKDIDELISVLNECAGKSGTVDRKASRSKMKEYLKNTVAEVYHLQ